MRIGVTGSDGLLGWHFRCYAKSFDDVDIKTANRTTFNDPQLLTDFAKSCDAIVHFAGVNRGTDEEVSETNPALAQALVDACDRAGVTPHIVYSSSTHADHDTIYGNAKRLSGEVLADWAEKTGTTFTNIIFPHIYGECGKPFYNSVVSTFCHQLANGEVPEIQKDGALELLWAQHAAALALSSVRDQTNGTVRPEGRKISVSDMLARLRELSGSYTGGIIPDFGDDFDLQLFNTFRSYLFPDKYPVQLVKHTDDRGSLFEGVKTRFGGQAFLSTTKPGITRGDHFHFRKIERFLVVQGEAVIKIRRLFSDEVHEFKVSGDTPVFVDMPTLHTHNITNTGDSELLTLFWSHEIFDPSAPDTLHEPV